MLVSSRLLPSVVSSTSMTMYENNNTSRSQQTPLIPPTTLPKHFNVPFAIQHGYFRCIRYLLQLNYDPNERDSQLRTPLVLCAYVENDRWSLSLAQNLLEKGAKIALEDHARRNAYDVQRKAFFPNQCLIFLWNNRMHHACALQRLHLVQVYLSCLDFNIEAKDCEGNTCLHYAAITGNCEIAELIIRAAEKLNIRLDQYVNREGEIQFSPYLFIAKQFSHHLGCSAAVLALKYGHIECANQITHRDWDEFFVIPRPLSIYETPPTTDDNQTNTTTTASRKKRKSFGNHLSPTRAETRPATLSFGLLKIIFNEGDTGYSTRLAGLCKQEKQTRHRQHSKTKKHEAPQTLTTTIKKLDRTKSTIVNGTENYSTEALVNETQLSNLTKERRTSVDSNGNGNPSDRTSPRVKLLMQQHPFNQSNSTENDHSFIQPAMSKSQLSIDDLNRTKSKMATSTIYRQTSNSTLNQSENDISTHKLQRPKTAMVRNHKYVNPPPSRLNSPKTKPTNIPSASHISRQPLSSTIASESTDYSRTGHAVRAASAVVRRTVPRSNDSAGSIREAKGTASRFNKPEELFGLRPEELFASEQHQPKILDPRSTNENSRFKRNQLHKQSSHFWQQDVDKIIELYNIHHTSSYRKSAVPPTVTQPVIQIETLTESSQGGRFRRGSISKTSTTNPNKPAANSKQSTFAVLNLPRRNSFSRPPVKLTNP